MPNKISNTASLTFEYGSQIGYASSNTAVTGLRETLSLSKTSLGSLYYLNDNITYILAIENNSDSNVTDLKISDDLGTYSLAVSGEFTPLSYVAPSKLYINGVFSSEIKPEIATNQLVFNVDCIPAGMSATIIYRANVNDRALLEAGSSITSTASLRTQSVADPITSSNTITASEIADVKIIKHMCPQIVTRGEIVTYNFTLYNYGNTAAVNVILTDTFLPAPTLINVSVNSQELPFSDYSYSSSTLTIPAYSSSFSLSVPPAQFLQSSATGMVTVNPGVTTVTVTGRV